MATIRNPKTVHHDVRTETSVAESLWATRYSLCMTIDERLEALNANLMQRLKSTSIEDRITKYEIFRVNVPLELVKMNDLLANGWELYGFPMTQFVSVSTSSNGISQSAAGSI